MNTILNHLKNCGVDTFPLEELDEPLMLMYKVLSWAIKSEADTLAVHENFVTWSKNNIEIDRLEPQKLIPVLGFQKLLEKIIERDYIVKNMLEGAFSDGEMKIYKLNGSISK